VFKKIKNKHKPIERGFYAFNTQRAGDFLIFYKKQEDYYEFVYVPGADLFRLTFENFNQCIENNILSFVEVLPKKIFDETVNFMLSNSSNLRYRSNDEIKNDISEN
jgi:hypothetical protein